MQVPLSETVCGLPSALSVTESVPVTLPVALGVNVTMIGQLAPEARLAPQVSVSPKSAVATMLSMFSVAVP
jgi:hypothetical protein